MSKSQKAPWFKFYGADWRADLSLRECSYGARGLWMDMLTIMHEAEPYGHLLISGKPVTAKRLSALLGGTEKEVSALLAELSEAEVFSRTEEGVIYSRRMVRDAERDAENKANGKKGGNPYLTRKVNPTPTPPDKGGVNPPVNPEHNRELNGGDKAQSQSQKPDLRKESINTRSPVPDSRERGAAPLMPTLNDPPTAWLHLADRMPDGTAKVERDEGGVVRPCCAGSYLDVCAELVAEAARMDAHTGSLDWRTLCGWLRDGIEMDVILAAIRRIASRPGYDPPSVLRYFDGAVRAKRGAA